MKRLIVIDVDGTLRNSKGEISSFTKKEIEMTIRLGHLVVICTARPRYDALKILNEAGISNYIISSNGSEIYDANNKKVIWNSFLTKEECTIMYNYAKKANLRIVFSLENIEYATKFTRNKNQILLNDEKVEKVINGNVKQILVIGEEREKILEFKDIVANKYQMNILDSSNLLKKEIWFSVVSKKASKGNALLKLAKHLNVPVENTVAIGNDNNDISMLKKAGLAVAVNNGSELLKKSADIIIDSNDNEAVAHFLKKINQET